jgi:hypothetical protein
MVDFKKVASDAVASSFVMSGRTEMKNDAVLSGFPNGVTITGFDIIPVQGADGKTSEMTVYTIAENEKVYCKGGSAHTKVFHAWLDAAGEGATAESVSAELAAAGGVKVKAKKTPLKNGRTYTAIEVL